MTKLICERRHAWQEGIQQNLGFRVSVAVQILFFLLALLSKGVCGKLFFCRKGPGQRGFQTMPLEGHVSPERA